MWVTLGNVGGRDAGLGSGAPRPEMGAGPAGPCQPPCRQQPAQYSLVTIKTLINHTAGRVPANHTGETSYKDKGLRALSPSPGGSGGAQGLAAEEWDSGG